MKRYHVFFSMLNVFKFNILLCFQSILAQVLIYMFSGKFPTRGRPHTAQLRKRRRSKDRPRRPYAPNGGETRLRSAQPHNPGRAHTQTIRHTSSKHNPKFPWRRPTHLSPATQSSRHERSGADRRRHDGDPPAQQPDLAAIEAVGS